MGEYANLVVNGKICDLCLLPFSKKGTTEDYKHGHPATCNECWETMNDEERKHHQRQDKAAET